MRGHSLFFILYAFALNLHMCNIFTTFAVGNKKEDTMAQEKVHITKQEHTQDLIYWCAAIVVYLERMDEPTRTEFIDKMLYYLPLLYVKTKQLPRLRPVLEGEPERFVTEMDYNTIQQKVASIFGSDDVYLEVFVEEMQYSDEPITAFISENIADIYQELRDLCSNFQLDDDDVQNDALYAYVEAFEQHWGQKLLNVLRPLHMLSMMKESDLYD